GTNICGLHLNSDHFPLPWNQQSRRASFIRRDCFKAAARCDKGRLQIEFPCPGFPSPSNFFGPSHYPRVWPRSEAALRDRPFLFGQLQCALRCFAKCLTAARGKMPVIREVFGGETYCGAQELVILQNMKRWPVCHFRFLLAPLPKRTEHGSRAAPQQTRSAEVPKFLLIPHAFHRCLFNCALAGLPQPIESIALFQLRLEAFGKRQ